MVNDGIEGGQCGAISSAEGDRIGQEGRGDAQCVRFSGRVYFRKNDLVNVLMSQGCRKIVEQLFGSGIGVGLEYAEDPLFRRAYQRP